MAEMKALIVLSSADDMNKYGSYLTRYETQDGLDRNFSYHFVSLFSQNITNDNLFWAPKPNQEAASTPLQFHSNQFSYNMFLMNTEIFIF
jgi:hypothetical protein